MLGINNKKRIPIGYENFKEVIDKDFYYVDKSMLIYDLIRNGGKNNLITRPRRFGKTLNFSMLKYFFDIRHKDDRYLFDDLKISKYYDELSEYRNTHPVITLSLKSAKQLTYKSALDSLCDEIRSQFIEYEFIVNSDKLSEADKEAFIDIYKCKTADEELFKQAVKKLCKCLKQYYGVNTIILIDEYDVPLENAYFAGFYDEMVGFIRSIFESALKTNDALEFSVITGCLRISKESIFTGLNNLAVNSILSPKYSEYFGFVQNEVDDILDYYELREKDDELKNWYDGYLFGSAEVYNPWSVLSQVSEWLDNIEAMPKAHWINTSSNAIVRNLIENADENVKTQIESLIKGESIEAPLRETITYGDMNGANDNIWSFLFFTGYLKVKSVGQMDKDSGDEVIYELIIPNIEVKSCYNSVIMEYFNKYKKSVNKKKLFEALLNKDAETFSQEITQLLDKSISYYDNKESFYHGLIAGLLSEESGFKVLSNREMGIGRSDLVIYDDLFFEYAIILEFKAADENERIDTAAKRALDQINEKRYDADALGRGYSNIIKYGIAFKNKVCYAVVE